MTDAPSPADPGPVDPDVQLASAHLDGEAGDDERDRADDPVVRSHEERFRAVAAAVGDVPPPPPDLVDVHVAQAMDAFDEGQRVVSLSERRPDQPWWQRIPLGAVAAALVVVALVGAIGLASRAGDGGDGDDTATAALESDGDHGAATAAGGGTSEERGAADAQADSAPSAGAMAGPVGRRAFASYEDLADQLRAELDPTATSGGEEPTTSSAERGTTDDAGPVDPCGAVEQLGLDPTAVLLVRPAFVEPDAVTVVVHDAADGRRLTVVDDDTCIVMVDQLL